MWVMFDLDGVLVDTAGVIRWAYAQAGVRPPENILATEGTDWVARQLGVPPVDDQVTKVRAIKHSWYLTGLRFAPTLPGLSVAGRLRFEGHTVGVLTGAPRGTIDVMKSTYPWWCFDPSIDSIRTPAKMELLDKLNPTGVYVDDQERLVDVPPGWRFVRYVGQSEDELYKQVVVGT